MITGHKPINAFYPNFEMGAIMKFIADFHVHSRFSRATSKKLDLEQYYIAAQQKGITVVGTGDFTHPAWFAEIREKLEPAEPGLFKLKSNIAAQCDAHVDPNCRGTMRFILTCEISNIYKKNMQTRKNHNLVFFPGFQKADEFNKKLDAIGNIRSDGRPILGLDARHLLEIVLETDDTAFLVPAHIWTPWFSLLGSKSGFDSIAECFEDLAPYIFAAETGLSSDPAMNWRVPDLDRLTLISNSDAHSQSKLGREANIFKTTLSYDGIRRAMETGDSETFLGTYEFYPEEGKYHMDGHRKCGICFHPEQTRSHNGICPVCNKPLTRGVLYRIEELSDRPDGFKKKGAHPFYSILPLTEILSDILQVGPQSKKVAAVYEMVLQKLGNEFSVLYDIPIEAISAAGIPLLAEAINRMRRKEIRIKPGYDGAFGQLSIFTTAERDKLNGQQTLFQIPKNDSMGLTAGKGEHASAAQSKAADSEQSDNNKGNNNTPKIKKSITKTTCIDDLNAEQQQAVRHDDTPLLIVAGPGTGKTLTLTHRIAYLIAKKNVAPENILAVTFTNKAAGEMAERLKKLLGDGLSLPFTATFHSLCLNMLKELKNKQKYIVVNEFDRQYCIAEALRCVSSEFDNITFNASQCLDMIVAAKQKLLAPEDTLDAVADEFGCDVKHLETVYQAYQNLLSIQGMLDFEDLIFRVIRLLEKGKNVCKQYQERFQYIFVDEYQDLNHGQYRLVRALAPPEAAICVIGDPDQSIYGFRGSDVEYFNRFITDYPSAEVIHLKKNYRSTETILEASHQVIRDQHVNLSGVRTYSDIEDSRRISIIDTENEKSEAVAIGKMIEEMVGGFGFHSIDFNKVDSADKELHISFSDIAILFRTHAQSAVLEAVLSAAGIPVQIVSKEKLYDEKGIRELLSILKLTSGCGTFADLERCSGIMGRGIGKKAFSVFKNWCYQNQFSVHAALLNCERFPISGVRKEAQYKFNDFFKWIIETGDELAPLPLEKQLDILKSRSKPIAAIIDENEKTMEAYERLIAVARETENREQFLEQVSLQNDVDCYNDKRQCVSLLTIHAAKGLEFPVVFIAGCEDGYLPYMDAEIAEEKRLFYVAMTRAKSWLTVSYARKRRVFGETIERDPSPFIGDIENELLNRMTRTAGKKKKKEKRQVQLRLFS